MIVLLAALSSACHAQGDPQAGDSNLDGQQQQIEELEKIVAALERIHPEIVDDVRHETCEVACHQAIKLAPTKTAIEFAECFKAAEHHDVDVDSNEAMLKHMRAMYPDEMAKHNDLFWRMTLDSARMEFKYQQAMEAARAEERRDEAAAEAYDTSETPAGMLQP